MKRPMWRRYLRFVGSDIDADVDEELQFHLEMRTQEFVDAGMEPDAARTEALERFGDFDEVKNLCREEDHQVEKQRRRRERFANLRQDLRYTFRTLRKSPGFTTIAVLTLALGIGATTAIFSIVSSVLLRPLPYDEPERVISVWNYFEGEEHSLSAPELLDYRKEIQSFDQLAAYNFIELNLLGDGEPERLNAARVTANIFGVLGTEALLGRTFTPEEDVQGRDNVAVLGYGLWQRRFGGDPEVIGSTIRLHGRARTVVGVMPPAFRLPEDYQSGAPSEVWVPMALHPEDPGGRGFHNLDAVARLQPGATLQLTNAELEVVTRRWIQEGITDIEGFTAFALPIKEDIVGDVRPKLLMLFGAVGFVLLIACANVANLLLTRADGRRKEICVRLALGSGRARIMEQLLVENLVLAVIGGALGLLLSFSAVKLLIALDPANLPRMGEITLDGGALLFALFVTIFTALLFGAAPIIQASRSNLVDSLKEGGRNASTGRRGQRFRRALVVGEIALSVVLVIGAGLMIRSFQELQQIELGLDPQDVLTMRLTLSGTEYPGTADMVAFYRQLPDRLETLPIVTVAGGASTLPLAGEVGDWGIDIEGQPAPTEDNFSGHLQVVTPGYFEAMGVERVSGRFITKTDRPDGMPAVVVNETMARIYWPSESAVGKRMRIRWEDEGPWFTVVGVVGDVRHNTVTDDPRPLMYFPHAQLPLAIGGTTSSLAMVIKTTVDPLSAMRAVREVVHSMDADLPIAEVRSMKEIVDSAFSETRFIMLLLAIFAGIALVLGSVGIYGVIAYAVTRRTREIGLRMALGAQTRNILRLVVGQGAVLALAGVALGLLAAFAGTRLLSSSLYGVSATDPLVFVGVAMLLSAIALFASYLPARDAARVDPMIAIHGD